MPTNTFHRRVGPERALASLAMIGSRGHRLRRLERLHAGWHIGDEHRAVDRDGRVSRCPTPTAVPSASPSPLAALTLLWQKGAPSTVRADTYWPAIDPLTGNVWVASSFDNQYWIFSADGKFLEAWGTPGKGPGQFQLTTNDPKPDAVGAIAFAPDGSFYVVDNGNYRVENSTRTASS